MSLEPVLVRVVRLESEVTSTFSLSKPVEQDIPGSPFLALVYRVAQTTVGRDDAAPGTATLDEMQRISVPNPACPIRINDIAFLPRADGSFTRAKIVRPRFYSDRCQYDLETGAEGDLPAAIKKALVDIAEQSSAEAADQVAALDIAEQGDADARDNAVGAGQSLAAAPTTFDQPYDNPHTDDTHLVFAHTVMAAYNGVYNDGFGAVGTIAGWQQVIQELMLCGVDGLYCNLFGLSAGFVENFNNVLAAAGLENAKSLRPDGTYASNGQGVTQFRIVAAPDQTSAGAEDQSTLSTLANLFIGWSKDPSYFKMKGQPVLSFYVGDGGGAATVKSVYSPMLAQIRAAGVDVLFLPGWGGDSGSTSVDEILAAGGDGVTDLFGATNVLGVNSQLGDIEALAALVQAAKTPAGKPLIFGHSILPYGYTKDNKGTLLFYNEAGGGRAKTAQFDSLINVTHAPLVVLDTLDDADEGTAIGSGAANAYLPGHNPFDVYGANIQGYYQQNAGLRYEFAYDIRRYKTGQTPLITQFQMVIHNRTQLAAVATANGVTPGQITGIAGDPPGLLDTVNITIWAPRSAVLRLSNVGPQQFLIVKAGFNQVCFYNVQAGTPFAEVLVRGQVVCQVAGHAIASAAPQTNLKPASFASAPGVKFTLTAPIPAGYNLDHVALMCRSTSLTNKALGVCNGAAYNLSTPSPTLFAQNTLNAAGAIGQTIDQVLPPGMDPLSQYDLGYGVGQVRLLADPLDNTQPPLAFPGTPNSNCLYDFAGKPLPSTHILAHCRVVATNPDPNADGQGGCGFVVRANTNAYFGVACWTYVEKYAGKFTLFIKADTNVANDQNSAGPNILASLSINALAPGEWYDVDLTTDGTTLVATATPSNQQL